MGGNGSHANGTTKSDIGQAWKTIGTVGDIQVIQRKNSNESLKLPEESRTANRVYAIFNKDGSDVKAIAKYGSDGKKMWEIHTTDHDNMGPHWHPWKDGRPVMCWDASKGKMRNVAHALTPEMELILNMVRNYGN